jgi:hypothetical protein
MRKLYILFRPGSAGTDFFCLHYKNKTLSAYFILCFTQT